MEMLGKNHFRWRLPPVPAWVISKINTAMGRISVLENRLMKITQTEQGGERREGETEQGTQDLWDNSKSLTYV